MLGAVLGGAVLGIMPERAFFFGFIVELLFIRFGLWWFKVFVKVDIRYFTEKKLSALRTTMVYKWVLLVISLLGRGLGCLALLGFDPG